MTSHEEMLREWFVSLSDMIGGPLEPDSELADGLEWFSSLSDETLAQINALGRDNPAIEEFLQFGRQLLKEVSDA